MASKNSEPVEIDDCVAIHETNSGYVDKGGLLIRCASKKGVIEVWIPKSQIHDNSEVYDSGDHAEGTLIIPEWLAIEKDLI